MCTEIVTAAYYPNPAVSACETLFEPTLPCVFVLLATDSESAAAARGPSRTGESARDRSSAKFGSKGRQVMRGGGRQQRAADSDVRVRVHRFHCRFADQTEIRGNGSYIGIRFCHYAAGGWPPNSAAMRRLSRLTPLKTPPMPRIPRAITSPTAITSPDGDHIPGGLRR